MARLHLEIHQLRMAIYFNKVHLAICYVNFISMYIDLVDIKSCTYYNVFVILYERNRHI